MPIVKAQVAGSTVIYIQHKETSGDLFDSDADYVNCDLPTIISMEYAAYRISLYSVTWSWVSLPI